MHPLIQLSLIPATHGIHPGKQPTTNCKYSWQKRQGNRETMTKIRRTKTDITIPQIKYAKVLTGKTFNYDSWQK